MLLGCEATSGHRAVSWSAASCWLRAPVLPLLIAGVSLLLLAGGGLYWLIPGIVLCLLMAVLDAWVLLVEILR